MIPPNDTPNSPNELDNDALGAAPEGFTQEDADDEVEFDLDEPGFGMGDMIEEIAETVTNVICSTALRVAQAQGRLYAQPGDIGLGLRVYDHASKLAFDMAAHGEDAELDQEAREAASAAVGGLMASLGTQLGAHFADARRRREAARSCGAACAGDPSGNTGNAQQASSETPEPASEVPPANPAE